MRNIFLTSLFILVIHCVTQGQNDNPVSIRHKLSSKSDTLILAVEFKVDSNWMVYDSIAGEVGPIPISFDFVNQTNLKLIKQVKPKLREKHDEIFDVDLWYFKNIATYQFYFVKVNVGEPYSIILMTEYMSCNLTTGICLPPATKEFKTKE